tara:strand:+ start:80 stop:463 length:384 start_codon:yes stop_codon:yes gene_type:complete
MGNIFSDQKIKDECKDLKSQNDNLKKQLKECHLQIDELKKGILKKHYTGVNKKEIKEFIDEFYEENKDVDIGKINTPLGEIDLLPDVIEKHLLTQSILISVNMIEKVLENTSIDVFNKKISIDISDL